MAAYIRQPKLLKKELTCTFTIDRVWDGIRNDHSTLKTETPTFTPTATPGPTETPTPEATPSG